MSAECSAGNIPPGYKQTEVGVIPEDWDVVTTLDACSKIQDGTHFSPQISGNDYLYITSKNIRFGYLDISTASRIDTAQHQVIYRRCDVKKGDLLLTKDGASTGNAALNTLDEEFSLLSSVAFLRFHQSKYCAAYFLQQILTSSGQHQIQDAMAGNAITRLTLEKIRKLRFPVPPTLAEQEAIAEALSDTDALIESLEQLIAKKRQIKQGAMQELLTGKRRLPGFEIKQGYKHTEVGVIPEDWEVHTLGEIGKFKNGLNKDSQAFGHGSPFVNLMDVFGVNSIASKEQLGLVECTSFEQCIYDLRCGDVIFVRSSVKPSGVGLTVVVENDLDGTVYSGFLIRFRDDGFIDTSFKKYCFYEEGFRKAVIGNSSVSANTNINQDSLKRLSIPLPPTKNEQEAIASIISDMDSEITVLEEKLAKARQIKQGMMQELLTGKIRLI